MNQKINNIPVSTKVRLHKILINYNYQFTDLIKKNSVNMLTYYANK